MIAPRWRKLARDLRSEKGRVLLMIAAIAGMADFYKWEYEYGHNLDYEHASIKIPGMAYQPPLIGSKKLLNFTATSLPATGGVLAIASVALAVGAAVSVSRGSRRSGK